MVIKFCEELLAKIRASQISYAERLTSGTFKNFEEYKHYVGKLDGLKQAECIVQTVYDNVVNASRTETQGAVKHDNSNSNRNSTREFY